MLRRLFRGRACAVSPCRVLEALPRVKSGGQTQTNSEMEPNRAWFGGHDWPAPDFSDGSQSPSPDAACARRLETFKSMGKGQKFILRVPRALDKSTFCALTSLPNSQTSPCRRRQLRRQQEVCRISPLDRSICQTFQNQHGPTPIPRILATTRSNTRTWSNMLQHNRPRPSANRMLRWITNNETRPWGICWRRWHP